MEKDRERKRDVEEEVEKSSQAGKTLRSSQSCLLALPGPGQLKSAQIDLATIKPAAATTIITTTTRRRQTTLTRPFGQLNFASLLPVALCLIMSN